MVMVEESCLRLEKFTDFLREQYYAKRTRIEYKREVYHFLRWCESTTPSSTEILHTQIVDYLARYSSQAHSMTCHTARAALNLYSLYCTGEKPSSRAKPNGWVHDELQGYRTFLERVAALRETTISAHYNYASRFLHYVAGRGVLEVSQITATYVKDFLSVELAHYRPSSRKTIIGRIRSYFR